MTKVCGILQVTGGSDWDLYRDPFVIELENVRLIRVTWAENDLTVGIKKLVVVVCESVGKLLYFFNLGVYRDSV